jgi:hypothetical protein
VTGKSRENSWKPLRGCERTIYEGISCGEERWMWPVQDVCSDGIQYYDFDPESSTALDFISKHKASELW